MDNSEGNVHVDTGALRVNVMVMKFMPVAQIPYL